MKRYDRELSLEIDRTVKRFNDKIKRLEKAEKGLDLPETITREDIVTYTTKKSTIEKKLKEYKRFLERGAEEVITTSGGARITRYGLKQLKERQKATKTSLTREINTLKNKPVKVAGKEQAGTFESMGDPYFYGLLGKREALNKRPEDLTLDELKRLQGLTNKLIYKKEKDIVFKSNYMEVIYKNAYAFGIDKRKADLIKEKLNKLTPDNFIKLYNTDKAIKAMFEYYLESKDIKSDKAFNTLQNSAEDLFDEIVNNIEEITEEYD